MDVGCLAVLSDPWAQAPNDGGLASLWRQFAMMEDRAV